MDVSHCVPFPLTFYGSAALTPPLALRPQSISRHDRCLAVGHEPSLIKQTPYWIDSWRRTCFLLDGHGLRQIDFLAQWKCFLPTMIFVFTGMLSGFQEWVVVFFFHAFEFVDFVSAWFFLESNLLVLSSPLPPPHVLFPLLWSSAPPWLVSPAPG